MVSVDVLNYILYALGIITTILIILYHIYSSETFVEEETGKKKRGKSGRT